MNAPTMQPSGATSPDLPLATAPSFIETQFPVSRLSKESYKERKANYSQTLTGLGKWWGRKPLIMVRAVILGLLMPASNAPRRDRDVFLALLTMDEEGLWRRKRKNIPFKEIYRRLSSRERGDWFAPGTDPGRPKLKKGTRAEEKERLQRIVFSRMGYDEKLVWCDRPEHVNGPSPEAWISINEHLGTSATTLPELVRELGERRFGHVPRVGDAFCGGGSVPFEAARLGCEAYGSDLNPVAALLTWGALNIVGGGEEVAERVRGAQAEVFDAVDRQITEWRIEHNDVGWRADAYLYCTETTCPECGWRVPLAPSWVIGEKTHTVAQLIAVPVEKCFSIDIRSKVSREALQAAREAGTVKQSRLHCPNPDCGESTPMAAIRGDRRGSDDHGIGLRLWQDDDLVPRPDDVFQERLYCVRWRLPSLEALLWTEQRAAHGGGATTQPRRNQDRNDAFLEAQTDLRAPVDLGARASSPRRAEGPAQAGAARMSGPSRSSSGHCTQSDEPTWHNRGYLPHFEGGEVPQSITFRLHDSLPAELRAEWACELENLPDTEQRLERRKRIEAALDSGYGACHLAKPEVARLVVEALGRFDHERYRLHAWCVMPNHVHVLVTPLANHTLTSIVRSWKSYTANRANRLLGRRGPFWMQEYFDRAIRDENHFIAAVEYIEHNPVKAGLCAEPADWIWSGQTSQDTSTQTLLHASLGVRASSPQEEDAGWKPALPGKAPVPDWVDLGRAIGALAEWLGADKRRELGELRKRDWLAENRALEAAQREFDSMKNVGCPKGDVKAAARRLKGLKEAVTQRNVRVETLAKSLPGTLYRAVDEADVQREVRALALLRERFEEWQALGYIPSRKIAPGAKTDEPIRTRGWTHWHHLFTPRQLLYIGTFSGYARQFIGASQIYVVLLQGIGKCIDWNSKLCKWTPAPASEKSEQTFLNQALNPLFSHGVRGLVAIADNYKIAISPYNTYRYSNVEAKDAREVERYNDLWITDPPYADAINYHELSEFFLAWYERNLPEVFPDWYTDSKRALAVQGAGTEFRRSMVDCYRNLAAHMPNNGLQVVMFTHQDASVWADLTLILWAAGLRVTAAWTIATETESALKEGNYVQGTVLMMLRKQAPADTVFLDELVPEVESEVERQLDSMLQLDDRDDRNFSDADYQLAAYAAALRVLTKYGSIQDIDIAYELSRERGDGEVNPIEALIQDAVRIVSNYRVPAGLPDHLWRQLGPEEKLYLKGLEVESHGEFRSGVYQEFARGFGVHDYRFMLRTGKANETRLKTASEFQRRELGETQFGQSVVRHALYAVWRAAESGEVAGSLTWLRNELADYWPRREFLVIVLRYLATLEIDHWREEAAAARVVAGAVENDHV